MFELSCNALALLLKAVSFVLDALAAFDAIRSGRGRPVLAAPARAVPARRALTPAAGRALAEAERRRSAAAE